MPPKKSKSQTTTSVIEPVGKVKIDTFILQIRNLCRARGLQIWNKQSLSDQIYKDILFIYHIPRLQRSGYLNLNVERIGGGKITEPSFGDLMNLKEPALIGTAFRRLWKELQVSSVSKLFDSREFAMFPIEKKDATKYLELLIDILKYASKVELAPYDSDSGHTYFNKDVNKSNQKTFGQFYTPGALVKSVIKELNISSKDTVLDPSCGSCSFIQEAGYTIKNEGKTAEEAFKNLYGVEIEPHIYVEGVLGIFTKFEILPDMNNNIREADAFKLLLSEETQYDKIPANPPFGADAKSFHDFYFKTTMEPKGKKLVKKTIVNPEVKFQIPFPNTSESAIIFFQMIVQKLKLGGKAGVVMSSTLLNDGNKEMIKWFLETCSLDKVIINPAGTFKEQGTGIETFSFIFTKGKPTTTVSIVMLGEEEKVVKSLTLAEIEAAGWKLQLKEEEKKNEKNNTFSYETISNLFKMEPCTIAASQAIEGTFPFMTLGDNTTHNTWAFDGENIFISKIPSGTGSTFTPKFRYSNGKVNASSLMIRLTPKTDKVLLKYFYYFWSLKPIETLRSFYKGAANKSLDQDLFNAFEMPLPPLHIQQEIASALDLIYNNAATAKAAADSVKAQMAAVVRSVSQRGYEKKKLGDVCDDVSTGKNIPSSERVDGDFKFFTCSRDYSTHNKYHYEGNFLVHGSRGSTIDESLFITEKEKFAIGTSMFLSSIKNESEIKLKFIYYYLMFNSSLTNNHVTSSAIPMITKTKYYTIEIPIPPLAFQEEVLTILNEMEAERKILEQMAAKAEERAKFILNNYLTPVQQETPEEEELVF